MAEESGDLVALYRAYAWLSDVLTTLGRLREGARVALDGLQELARLGIERSLGSPTPPRSCMASASGIAPRTSPSARSRSTVRSSGTDALMADAAVALGRGELERAGAGLHEAAELAASDSRAALRHVALVAELALLEGRPEAAREGLDRALAGATEPDEALRRAELCALGLRADAERSALARVRRDSDALDEVHRHADAVLADARAAADEAATVTPIAAGWRALAEAEHTRATSSPQPAAWAAAARRGSAWSSPTARRTAGAGRPRHS